MANTHDMPEAGPSDYVAPRTAEERAVAEIWAELLEVDPVGVDDNFLLLGGESLLATQAASRLRARFGRDVSVRSIFVSTVAEIAAAMTSDDPSAANTSCQA